MKYKFNNRYLFVQFAALIFRVSAELMSLVRLLHKTLPHTSTPVSTLALHITQPPPKFSIIFAFDLSRFFFFCSRMSFLTPTFFIYSVLGPTLTCILNGYSINNKNMVGRINYQRQKM